MPQTELIQAMRTPGFYPHPAETVDFIQTHISSLFLVGDHVYKLKKPLDLGFLDFSSLDKRRFYCREEVRLNSRLAPSVYLQVLPVSQDLQGGFVLGQSQQGQVVDYVVHMRRLSEDFMFPALLSKGLVNLELLQELAGILAKFHARATPVDADSDLGSPSLVRSNIQENFEQTRILAGTALSQKRFQMFEQVMFWILHRRHHLLHSRHVQGKTRECHGDLRMEHICMFNNQLVVFDCIEFNERFRFIDTAADLAFLLMDMEYSGHWQEAQHLLTAYTRASDDEDIMSVINLYKAYYAQTRGKVAGIQSMEEEFSETDRQEALNRATAFLDLAWSYAIKLTSPTLIVTCGLMGTGKSEVGRHLQVALGAELIQSDALRKSIHGFDPSSKHEEAFGQGLYSRAATQATYQALLDQARSRLQDHASVILDASFSRREDRGRVMSLAHALNLRCVLVQCLCPEKVVKKRLSKRHRDVSDGRWDLFAQQKAGFEPVTELGPTHHVQVDTSGDLPEVQEESVHAVLRALQAQEGLFRDRS